MPLSVIGRSGLRVAALGLQAATTVVEATVNTGLSAGEAAAATAGRVLAGEVPDAGLSRGRGALVGVNAAGLGIAITGRVLRLPRAPVAVDAAAAIANHQPWLRRQLGDRIGAGAADTVLSLAATAAHVVTLSPASLSVDLLMQILKTAEERAAAQARGRYEPQVNRHGGTHRPVPAPDGPVQRHARRMAVVQAIGAGLTGAVTGSVATASAAAVVSAPKAMRTATESFAATLGRGLADRHAVVPCRPESLRRLDRVDALLIDPRVLCDERAAHPLARAVVTEARAAGVVTATVGQATDTLDELRPAFDEVRPARTESTDQALAAALAGLQQAGHTVAVLSSAAARALRSADVALGIVPATGVPPLDADLILADLAGAWQVLHALPAAREASRRGITISTSASALGAVLMVPGVRAGRARRQGPGPVTVGAAAGLLSGYLLARRVVAATPPRPAPAYQWHAMTVEQVREVLPAPGADTAPIPEQGRAENGVVAFVRAVRAELSDPLTPVLAVGSAATALLGSPIDAVMVTTVLIGNAMLAAAQQLRAENRLNRLLAQQVPPARKAAASPDGTYRYSEVVAERLQPGDVIEVRSNEVVPADARVISQRAVEVDESSLTGESLSVDKRVEATPGAELADRRCMLYAGTTVVAGTVVALVTTVGADTQARRAGELAAGDPPVVGLQRQLGELMYRAFPVSAGGGALVGALGLLRGGTLRQALGNAIAVAVAAVPEGMPLMATLAQYASARRLSGTGALVRVPRSVEALGRIDVVCFDKTGTLSENRLRVTQVHPVAEHSRDDVLRCAAHAAPAANGSPHAHATDQAVIEAAAGVTASTGPEPDAFLPFRSGRAFSAAVTGTQLTVKGAPEVVLAACDDVGPDVEGTVAALAADGLRVIAVAQRTLTARQARSVREQPDRIGEWCGARLSMTGFLALADTPRAQAPQLLADLTGRGVDIRLITGDHPVTAAAIAAQLGVPASADQIITGSEWAALSRREQEQVVCRRAIFARMSPEHKVQIVQTLERAGRVCAMVGDGANDAAAIRAATVGVGVVARGSDSAHTIADVVLTDGRIDALVRAVDEGRRLWRGVHAAVAGLLGGNAGEVIFAVIGTALTGNSPLNTRQLLLMNTLTDALPATAVAVSTPSGPVQRVGQGQDEGALWRAVAVRGAITATAATAAWAMASLTGRPQRAATVALIALVSVELGQTLVDSHAPLVWLTAAGSFAAFTLMVGTPGISQLLGCTPVGPLGWAQALGLAAAATAAVAVATRLSAGRRNPEPAAASPEPEPAPQESLPRSPRLNLVDQPVSL